MDSIKKLYKIGYGPSSSHTMGPHRATKRFLVNNPSANHFKVELYGSLALTGKGHLTDYIIKKTLGEDTEVIFDINTTYDYHPNGMKFFAYKDDELINEWLVFSVGGGSLRELNEKRRVGSETIYPHSYMSEILNYCKENNLKLNEYVSKYDKVDDYLVEALDTMLNTINNGLNKKGTLPGRMQVERKANDFLESYKKEKTFTNLLYATALATAEENASGNLVVTSPTCGASGILPSVLYSYMITNNISKEQLIEALKVAGLIGNIVKYNASISGAEVGCQGEVGTACAMAASASAFLLGATNEQIEYAAEIALEHHLGLTCDPVDGLVQIPCIERNALASRMAIDSANYAIHTDGIHKISFDHVVAVMKETGKDLSSKYKETSTGGLAK